MSALYLEVSAELSSAQLISEVAIALQDKREVYVSCPQGEADRVERLLRRPFEATADLRPLLSDLKPTAQAGELEELHPPLLGEGLLFRHLLRRAELGSCGGGSSARGWGEGAPPQVPQAELEEITGTINLMLGLLKRELWEWYGERVKVSRARAQGRALFYCEVRPFESLSRSAEIPF